MRILFYRLLWRTNWSRWSFPSTCPYRSRSLKPDVPCKTWTPTRFSAKRRISLRQQRSGVSHVQHLHESKLHHCKWWRQRLLKSHPFLCALWFICGFIPCRFTSRRSVARITNAAVTCRWPPSLRMKRTSFIPGEWYSEWRSHWVTKNHVGIYTAWLSDPVVQFVRYGQDFTVRNSRGNNCYQQNLKEPQVKLSLFDCTELVLSWHLE